MAAAAVPAKTQIVVLKYADLVAGNNLTAEVEQAFGYNGLGILAVSGVAEFAEQRARLLPLGRRFANLSDEVKGLYEHPSSFYSFGWSHGKEKLQGRPDLAKGSFYNNPLYNDPFESDPDILREYASFAHPNIWPTEHLPELEGAFMSLGSTMCEVGYLVADQCDKLVKMHSPLYEAGKLKRTISTSRVTKARLLHYFPKTQEEVNAANSLGEEHAFSGWCGWHNDHGSLTALAPGMFHDEAHPDVPLTSSPDPDAGLYVRSRQGELCKVSAPAADHILFQIGESSQIHSGGVLQATPHAVRAAGKAGVSRTSFAVFMEPRWNEIMAAPQDRDPEKAQASAAEKALPRGVPPLGERWGTADCPFTMCDFGAFTKSTLNALH